MLLSKILFEAMSMEPPQGYTVVVSGDKRSITIKYRSKDKLITPRFPEGRFRYAGIMTLYRGVTVEDGLVWEVESVYSEKGFGPLLYDIAMEMVNKVGGVGLMSDRRSVSPEARKVWRKYSEDREPMGDVGRKRLPEDLFVGKNSERPEYMRYYYYKTSTPIIDDLKSKGLIESGDFEL